MNYNASYPQSDTKTLELDLFDLCKSNSSEGKADSGLLLRLLNNCGIIRTDSRLAPVMKELERIRRRNIKTLFRGVDNLLLDFNQFLEVIAGSKDLIAKAFRGLLVIPEFPEFCDDIEKIYKKCASNNSGRLADYIPELTRYDPDKWGVSLCTVDGQRYSIGDVTDYFSLQATSKPITYAICLNELGSDVVHHYIGTEPSGRVNNEIALDYNDKPHNPMVNSGAIMSAALLLYEVKPELSLSEKYEYVSNFFKRMCGGLAIGFNNSIFLSEREASDRNRALAYHLREKDCFPKESVDIQKVLEFYFQTCSMEMNVESLSILAATLASGGVCPITGERVLKSEAVRHVLSLMHSCGMYTYSGQFSFKVGLPAKSGASGIILVVVPNVVGFALWSPLVDDVGNSTKGIMFCEELVGMYGLTADTSSQDKKNPTMTRYEIEGQKLFLLQMAACNGDVHALERAYLQGIDMNMTDYDGRTALHCAAVEGHKECVKFLIETCDVDLNIKDRWGQTAIKEARKWGKKRISLLLAKAERRRKSLVIEENEEHKASDDERASDDETGGEIKSKPPVGIYDDPDIVDVVSKSSSAVTTIQLTPGQRGY